MHGDQEYETFYFKLTKSVCSKKEGPGIFKKKGGGNYYMNLLVEITFWGNKFSLIGFQY